MKKVIKTTKTQTAFIVLFVVFAAISGNAQKLNFTTSDLPPVELQPDKNTGLDKICVVYSADNTVITYEPQNSDAVITWLQYSNLGGGYAVEVKEVEQSGNIYQLTKPQPDMGYIIEERGATAVSIKFWLVDWSRNPLTLTGATVLPESDCTVTKIELCGDGNDLTYYTVTGQRKTINRGINLNYLTQHWDAERLEWVETETTKELPGYKRDISITPPILCDTEITVSGDTFLRFWHLEQTVESGAITAQSVMQHSRAEQQQTSSESDNKSNQIGYTPGTLGGSAPAVVNFSGYPSSAVKHSEWQISTDPEFGNIEERFVQQNLEYTFTKTGTSYARYVVSNADGSCTDISEPYAINIGASELKCPNAFSPGTTEGLNDEWKVSYCSITEFECWIFNRYGQELCYFDNPEKGWDGKYNGKLVKPGAYYYVIKALGSDGKEYKLSGDINILRYRSGGANSETE